jgi:GMP synthase-like glutamine amidotransferase
MTHAVKLAVIDNSIDPDFYSPCVHWREHLDVPFDAYRAKEGRLPSLQDGYTHFILTGSEASILERERWVGDEADWAADARHRGLCLLGSCWGHQLLAFALAGPSSVGRCREPEIGWIEVRIPAETPILGPAGAAWTFSFHFDEVKALPPAFRVLASTPPCPIQAFELTGWPVWGLQIHPEISADRGREALRRFAESHPLQKSRIEFALRSEPRDSGLIRRIAAVFLAVRPGPRRG